MSRLVPYMYMEVDKPAAPWLFASDAEGPGAAGFGGFGVANTGLKHAVQLLELSLTLREVLKMSKLWAL